MAILITDVDLISTDALGGQGNRESLIAAFSPDGTKVAFRSYASNLVAGDTNATSDIFLKDLTTGAITLLSADSLGIQGNGTTSDISFSPDGTKILLRSAASNLTPGDTNGTWDIFLKDLTTGAVSLVSSNSSGIQANHDVDDARFSPDGTKVLFSSFASNLVEDDINGTWDVFLKDLTTGSVSDIIRLFYVYGPELGETSNAFTGETIAFGASETTVGSQIDGGAGYDVVEMVDFRVFTVANFADGFELTNIERLVGNARPRNGRTTLNSRNVALELSLQL